MLRWIDADEPDDTVLRELLGDQREPLPSHKQVARSLLFLPSLASFGLRRRGERPDGDFVAATAVPLRCVWDGVVEICQSTATLVREASDAAQWHQALEQRTGIQLLVDWYGESLADLVTSLRLTELDAEIRGRSSRLGFAREGDVPVGVPASHWWWQLP